MTGASDASGWGASGSGASGSGASGSGASGSPSVGQAWERRARAWAAWARTPGHDVFFERLNWPAFAALLPAPGRPTPDVGCGEGRVGRLLAAAGHRVVAIDSSPTLVELAVSAGGYERVVCGSAAAMPFPDAFADLAVAFMSLHDMDEPTAAIGEIGRVLEPGGVLCVAIVHPLNRPSEALEDYFAHQRVAETVERDGLAMTFEAIDRPLEAYTAALARAGFVIEVLREPRAVDVAADSPLAPAACRPFFLHMHCRRG